MTLFDTLAPAATAFAAATARDTLSFPVKQTIFPERDDEDEDEDVEKGEEDDAEDSKGLPRAVLGRFFWPPPAAPPPCPTRSSSAPSPL